MTLNRAAGEIGEPELRRTNVPPPTEIVTDRFGTQSYWPDFRFLCFGEAEA